MFVRTVTSEGLKQVDVGKLGGGVNLVFNPAIFDRTDWYAYYADRYGRTTADDFSQRESPEELFKNQKERGFSIDNEQMFRLGISFKDVLAISSSNKLEMVKAVEALKKNGINQINGRPVEEMVVLANQYTSLIDISNGNQNPEIKNLAELTRENPEEMEKLKWAFLTDFTGLLENRISEWDYLVKNPNEVTSLQIDDCIYNIRYYLFKHGENTSLEEFFRNQYRRYISASEMPDKYKTEILEKLRTLSDSVSAVIGKLPQNYERFTGSMNKIKTNLELYITELNKSNQ